MVKKISFLILSAAILSIGIIAFNKLGYWDSSVRIFSFNSNATFEGRMNRGPEGRREFARTERHEFPDSPGARSDTKEGRPDQGMTEGNISDTIRQQFGPRNGGRIGRGSFEGEIRNGEGHRRGEFTGGKKINIRNVKWFLAVFALFTIVVIYIDKAYCLLRKRKLI